MVRHEHGHPGLALGMALVSQPPVIRAPGRLLKRPRIALTDPPELACEGDLIIGNHVGKDDLGNYTISLERLEAALRIRGGGKATSVCARHEGPFALGLLALPDVSVEVVVVVPLQVGLVEVDRQSPMTVGGDDHQAVHAVPPVSIASQSL
jgi:hypothetical protein